MPETETRWDLEIRIRPNGDAGYRGTYRIGEERTHFALPGDALDDNGWYLVARLEQSGLEPMLEHWRRRRDLQPPNGPVALALQIDDWRRSGSVWDWDYAISRLLRPGEMSIRRSPVAPRESGRPFTLPLRIAHIGCWDPEFRRFSEEYEYLAQHDALLCRHVDRDNIERLFREWPTADILCLDGIDWPSNDEEVLSTQIPEKVGSLGWLDRLSDVWQTRLVVMIARTPDEQRLLRVLAIALANRGGPAIFVTDHAPSWHFYDGFIHNMSIREIVGPEARKGGTLHAGMGREDAVRISGVVSRLSEPEILQDIARSFAPAVADSAQKAGRRLAGIAYSGESQGLIPTAKELIELRRSIAFLGAARPRHARQAHRPSTGQRFTNCALWEAGSNGSLRQLDMSQRLNLDETYQLSVEISPNRDQLVMMVGGTALIEDGFKWEDGKPNVTLNVAIAGIDFDVLGSPLQQLILPHDGASDRIHFAVSPRRVGPTRLRVCIFYGNTLLQTLRLVAWTDDIAERARGEPEVVARALAAALGVPENEVLGLGYLTRADYGDLGAAESLQARPERAVGIVINDFAGAAVSIVKSGDSFAVRVDDNTSGSVRNLRGVLDAIGIDPSTGVSRYGSPADPNLGTSDQLEEDLKDLANFGSQLYDGLIPAEVRGTLCRTLDTSPRTIHIADVLFKVPIPWAAMYEGPYDAARTTSSDDAGNRRNVTHRACLVPIEKGLDWDCRSDPECLARPDSHLRNGTCDETLVCLRKFWGFRHILEAPIRQASSRSGGATGNSDQDSLPATISSSGGRLRLAAAINANLDYRNAHRGEIESLAKAHSVLLEVKTARDEIIDLLRRSDLGVVYLFCHAGDTVLDSKNRAYKQDYLNFGNEPCSDSDAILAGHLSGGWWTSRPLVVLNGCESVGGAANVTSRLFTALVSDRGASCLLATQTRVCSKLAEEVGRVFLREFLGGRTAGEALLTVRQSLLSRRNPLGLVYMLYGPADLKLAN
jgi:hypothetical protein